MKYKCEHFGIAAEDPSALRRWYEAVLDARLMMELSRDPAAYLMELAGGVLVEIYRAGFSLTETADNQLRGWRHLALRVDDLQAAREDLVARGVQFVENEKPAGGGGRVLFFSDPEGNLFHLVERPSGFRVS